MQSADQNGRTGGQAEQEGRRGVAGRQAGRCSRHPSAMCACRGGAGRQEARQASGRTPGGILQGRQVTGGRQNRQVVPAQAGRVRSVCVCLVKGRCGSVWSVSCKVNGVGRCACMCVLVQSCRCGEACRWKVCSV